MTLARCVAEGLVQILKLYLKTLLEFSLGLAAKLGSRMNLLVGVAAYLVGRNLYRRLLNGPLAKSFSAAWMATNSPTLSMVTNPTSSPRRNTGTV